MGRKRDFGPLLTLGDGKSRPPRRCRKEISSDIRLPPWERLLEIDRKAEAKAALAQMTVAGPDVAVDERAAAGAAGNT